jgi:GNAT superfamily N-acetyltransferase
MGQSTPLPRRRSWYDRAMSYQWIHESTPEWDDTKETIIGGAPDGIFHLDNYRTGSVIPGEWWHVEADGEIVGYGWMDANFGDAEILLAVAPDRQGKGVGAFILERLEREASRHGLNYMYNVVAPSHPDRDGITAWLSARGFERSHDDESLKRRVRAQAT